MEELLSKQTLTLTNFSEREKGQLSLSDTTRERLYHVSGENKVFQDRVGELEKRVLECDQQNRDLIGISSKKEEVIIHTGNSRISKGMYYSFDVTEFVIEGVVLV